MSLMEYDDFMLILGDLGPMNFPEDVNANMVPDLLMNVDKENEEEILIKKRELLA